MIMYLARIKKKNSSHYIIRQSFRDGDCYKSRDLFELGPDPSRYIIYPGGNGYYIDPVIGDVLTEAGVDADQNQLDDLFFRFLDPGIQRVITGFDRSRRRAGPAKKRSFINGHCPPAHLFDKRRFHYLRYGHSRQKFLNRVPEKYFLPLCGKSRDELENYFISQEACLRPQELLPYVSVIFTLNRFLPDPENHHAVQDQMDGFFTRRLCSLYTDQTFWAGMNKPEALRDYLARYAIAYFDAIPGWQKPAWQEYVEAFINAHRSYVPPAKIRATMERAAKLFGKPWKELKTMNRTDLTRLYRRLALQHHPDQGGREEVFLELTQAFQVLMKQKPRH
jgi:hypothetical protein